MNTNTTPGSAFRRSVSRVGVCAGLTALTAALVFGGAGAAQAAAPMAGDDFYAVTANTALAVSAGAGIFANDADPEADAFTIHSVFPNAAVLPGEGFNPGADGSFVYTPPTGFTGTRQWSYRIEDAADASAVAVITFTITAPPVVNTAPVANPDAHAVTQDMLLSVPAAGVLANDTDADGDALSVGTGFLPPAGGILPGESAALWPDGKFTYMPPTGYTGTRTWTYDVTDGTTYSAMTTIVFTITAPAPVGNVAPVGGVDTYSVATDGSFSLPAPGLLANDTDADGDTLTLVAQGYATVSLPGESMTTWSDGSMFYSAPTGFTGTREWWYEVSDGTHTVKTSIFFTIAPAPAGNVAPVANDDTYAVVTGSYDTTAPGVLSNDTDADGDTLSIAVVQAQAGGALPGESLVLDLDGAIHYVAPTGFTGIRSWRYRISDGYTQSAFAQITFEITAPPVANTAPVANADAYVVVQDVPFSGLGAGYLSNDTDADGDALEWSNLYAPNGGLLPGESLTMLTAGGSFAYTPPTGFTGVREFTYYATDGTDLSNLASLTFTISAANAGNPLGLPTLPTPTDSSTVPTALASTGSTPSYALGTLAAMVAGLGFVLARSSRRVA